MASVEIKSLNSKKIIRSSTKHQTHLDGLKSLNCVYLNATSLDNKLDEFKVVVDTYCPEIIAVSETWFKNNSIVNVTGYNIYRTDRCDRRKGGGVCLYIN